MQAVNQRKSKNQDLTKPCVSLASNTLGSGDCIADIEYRIVGKTRIGECIKYLAHDTNLHIGCHSYHTLLGIRLSWSRTYSILELYPLLLIQNFRKLNISHMIWIRVENVQTQDYQPPPQKMQFIIAPFNIHYFSTLCNQIGWIKSKFSFHSHVNVSGFLQTSLQNPFYWTHCKFFMNLNALHIDFELQDHTDMQVKSPNLEAPACRQ